MSQGAGILFVAGVPDVRRLLPAVRILHCILDNDGLVVFEEGEIVLFSDDHAYDFVNVLRQHIAVFYGHELSFGHKNAFLVPVAKLSKSQLLANLDVRKVPFVDVVTVVDA